MDYCQYCNGTLNYMGTLGYREHYNCQGCGLECSCYSEEYINRYNIVNIARRDYYKIMVEG